MRPMWGAGCITSAASYRQSPLRTARLSVGREDTAQDLAAKMYRPYSV